MSNQIEKDTLMYTKADILNDRNLLVNYVFGDTSTINTNAINEIAESDLDFCNYLSDLIALRIHKRLNKSEFRKFLTKDCKKIEDFIDNLK